MPFNKHLKAMKTNLQWIQNIIIDVKKAFKFNNIFLNKKNEQLYETI